MDFIGAIKSVFKQYANFRGLASRSEFWYFTLFTVLVSMVLSTIEAIIWPTDMTALGTGTWIEMMDATANQPTPLSTIASLALLLPSLAVTARRFHDAGFSGKWLLLNIVPFVVLFVSMAAWAVQFAANGAALYANEFEIIMSALAALLPSLLIALGVSVFQLVVTLRRTKTAAEGNKYAVKYAPVAAEEPVAGASDSAASH
ncbi:uncharacterized membrane protein YhaH (DUF805 family) [Microbacteriaceae bacterium MWH-Ta3]|nr:uncharacterized membrane protein YhaH (DUF805 family) [Microbacteriaceae bacterium MWH-Ta3]